MKRIKTGFLERRMELAKAGIVSGSSYFAHSALNAMLPKEERDKANRELLKHQAEYFVRELGKLKGSVVKIGQMLALYGEYFLPEEITTALHTLEDSTEPVEWPTLHQALLAELGEATLATLDIDPVPVAAASLSQVHRATDLNSGAQLCLKIQYPNVADSIDSDFDAVIQLLRISHLLSKKRSVEPLLAEIKRLLKQEVDYIKEATLTKQAAERLARDERFVVPRVRQDLSTARVLTLSYESGLGVTSPVVAELEPERRNRLGAAMLELFLRESLEWGSMQTDPNFGNFLIRTDDVNQQDQLVLLDFGAIKQLDARFCRVLRLLVSAAQQCDHAAVTRHAIELELMHQTAPDSALHEFADIIIHVIEPLRTSADQEQAAQAQEDYYPWRESRLPRRVAKRALNASLSRHFAMPPVEFMLLIRKLVGVYTFIAALDSQFNGAPVLNPFVADLRD